MATRRPLAPAAALALTLRAVAVYASLDTAVLSNVVVENAAGTVR